MRVRTMIITAATLAVFAAPGTLFAQGSGGGGFGGGGGGFGGHGFHGGGDFGGEGGFGAQGLHRFERMLPRMAEFLGLEDDDVAKIQEIVDQATADIQHQLNLMNDAVGDDVGPGSFHGEDFKAEELRNYLATTSPYKIEIHVIGAEAMNQILFGVLDAEQREMLKEQRGRMGRRRSGGQVGSGS